MANTANPTNPTPQVTTPIKNDDQNLDIHLDEIEKVDSLITKETKNTESDLDLNLDLNLEDAPQTDDRLKEEDNINNKWNEISLNDWINKEEKNTSIFPKKAFPEIPVIEEDVPVIKEDVPVIEEDIPVIEEDIPVIKEDIPVIEEDIPVIEEEIPVIKEDIPVIKEEIPVIEEEIPVIKEDIPVIEEDVPVIEKIPSSSIEEISSSPNIEKKENIIEPQTLKEDMKIIDDLQKTASVGWLDKEAQIDTQSKINEETTKTFDLDTMLWTTTQEPPVKKENIPVINETTNDLFKTKTEENKKAEEIQTIEQIPNSTNNITPIITPDISTKNENIYETKQIQNTTQQKDKNIKILLFVVLFFVLWFISYFIIKTMYPIEFENIINKNTTEELTIEETEELTIEETEELTGTIEELTGTTEELTGTTEELTGTTEEITEEIIFKTGNGDHESAVDFWELNNLWTNTQAIPEKNNISKLTDYVNKGNDLRQIGKELNNNTIIKFSLYTKNKATSFLEKIAKGEEINNLESYFTQFDKYIKQIEELITTSNTTETGSSFNQNNIEETTTEPEPITNEF